jgi:hypothetical protein
LEELRLQGTWTDGWTDRVIPIYPPNFVCGGIIKIAIEIWQGYFSCDFILICCSQLEYSDFSIAIFIFICDTYFEYSDISNAIFILIYPSYLEYSYKSNKPFWRSCTYNVHGRTDGRTGWFLYTPQTKATNIIKKMCNIDHPLKNNNTAQITNNMSNIDHHPKKQLAHLVT